MFYPLVGFVLGSILWATHSLLQDFVPAAHLDVLIFALWVLITGGLHLDGFSDSVDGLFVNKARALKVMKDSQVGGMGMIFTVVFLALKLSSLVHFDAYWLLPLVLAFSRLNATMAIYFYDYVSDGMGKLVKEELTFKHLLFALFYSLALGWLFSFTGAFLVSLFVLLVSAKFFASRLKGLTGDVYGFIIELSELALLNYIVVMVNFQ